jgi:hypothetical protein
MHSFEIQGDRFKMVKESGYILVNKIHLMRQKVYRKKSKQKYNQSNFHYFLGHYDFY